MKNMKLTLEYDGTNYQGWQHVDQKGRKGSSNTVCGKITDTLCRLTGESIELFCAERTEPGVHASCQTVSFKTGSALSASEIKRSLNQYLPQDIAVLSAREVPERFHAALNCISRTYTYRIQTHVPLGHPITHASAGQINPVRQGMVPDVFTRKYTLYVPEQLDIDAMAQGAAAFVGTRDFSCFSSGKKKKSTEKTVLRCEIISPAGRELHIVTEANGFLHLMPRLIVGTLLDIGLKKRTPACIPAVFSGEEAPGRPAPAHGLCLTGTHYNAADRSELYGFIKDGLADIQNGDTRPFSETISDLRNRRKR